MKRSTRIETLQRIERARAFIHAEADRNLTSEEIAGVAALSRFHLTRSFADAFGLPPLAYHRRLRLDRAAALIRADGDSATTIAAWLGYASLSAFTRAFRQHFNGPSTKARTLP